MLLKPQLPPKAVLFDLDGTLSDSVEIIITCFQKMAREMLGKELEKKEFLKFVGPPLARSMAMLDPDADAQGIEQMITCYRNHYLKVYENTPLFAGVVPMLQALHARGIRLGLATSKLQVSAKRVLEIAGIDHYFEVVSGSLPAQGVETKADVVAQALKALNITLDPKQPSEVVMVGDRIYDVLGAGEHFVPTLFVTWANTASEGEDSLAFATVSSPEQVLQVLGL